MLADEMKEFPVLGRLLVYHNSYNFVIEYLVILFQFPFRDLCLIHFDAGLQALARREHTDCNIN